MWRTSVWRFFRNFKIEVLYDPAILSLGIYPKEASMKILGLPYMA